MANYSNWLKKCVYRVPQISCNHIYQGMGPGGTALILYGKEMDETRLYEIFQRNHGVYGRSVAWLFREKGQILISKYHSGMDENTLVLEGLGAGAEDVRFDDGDLVEVLCNKSKLRTIMDIFEIEDISVLQSNVVLLPKALTPLEDIEQMQHLLFLLEDLLELEQIYNFTADFWIADDRLEHFV